MQNIKFEELAKLVDIKKEEVKELFKTGDIFRIGERMFKVKMKKSDELICEPMKLITE